MERFNLKWIKKDYTAYSEYVREWFLSRDMAEELFYKIKDSLLLNEISSYFSVPDHLKKKMEVFWKQNIFRHIAPFANQYAMAEYLIAKNKYSRVTVLVFNLGPFLKAYSKANIKIVVLPFFLNYHKIYERVNRTLSLKRLINTSLPLKRLGKKKNQPEGKSIKTESFKVAFFPHKGVLYGKLFVKDHFYSKDIRSPFFKANILHISLNEAPNELSDSYKYYDANNIPYMDSKEISKRNKDLLLDCLKLIFKERKKVSSDLCKYGLDFVFMAMLAFYQINRYYFILTSLKGLKVALCGYDFLFPIELSIACSLKGVKVCASQERFFQAFHPQLYLIFDYYFIASPKVSEQGLKNCFIEHCIPSGLVRVDNLFDYEQKNIPDGKYDVIKKNKKLVLALDYHLPTNAFEDINYRYGIATVKNIRRFYKDLIRLATDFPSLHIVIKGKETKSYESPYIADIVDSINSLENIEIELDLEKYNPYYIAEKADLTIALHTSLVDELLAAGRKVLLYEVSDHIKTIFNYDNLLILVKDYKSLKYHIQNFLNGIYLTKDEIDNIKKHLYGNYYDGKVKERIQGTLEQLTSN